MLHQIIQIVNIPFDRSFFFSLPASINFTLSRLSIAKRKNVQIQLQATQSVQIIRIQVIFGNLPTWQFISLLD